MGRWFLPVPDPRGAPEEWPGALVMASTILGEAAGEPLEGKQAVAAVIMNRARDHRWPDRPEEVCLQKMQFSCWNIGSPTLPRMFNPKSFVSEEVWGDCLRAALEAIWGLIPDPTNGANHYLNPTVTRQIRGGTLPSWHNPAKITATIGAHEFLRL